MKPVASILALAIALASNVAFASPETEGVKDTVKIEKKEEAKKDAVAKDGKNDKKIAKHHARSVSKGRAHGHDKAPAVMPATMRSPATTKEAKPAKTKKADKKGDQKHPEQHAGVEIDPGARDHQAAAPADLGHAEPPSLAAIQVEAPKGHHAQLPELPAPSGALKNASAHEPVAKEPVAKKHGHAKKDAKTEGKPAAKAPCIGASVEFLRGAEVDSFPLAQCDGSLATHAQEKLSIVLRPASAARPLEADLKKSHKANEIASGIMKADAGLAQRLEKVMDHFKTDGHMPKVAIVSGSRPTSVGSLHALARAIDFRLEGVDNVKLAEFCKTLPDTGCGYYPNSSFVHMDVREPGSGHTAWIDASGPGEAPRYVSQWPLPVTETADAKPAAQPEKVASDSTEAAETPAETPAH